MSGESMTRRMGRPDVVHDGLMGNPSKRLVYVRVAIRQRGVGCVFSKDNLERAMKQVRAGTAEPRIAQNLGLFNNLPMDEQIAVIAGQTVIAYDISGNRSITPIVKNK